MDSVRQEVNPKAIWWRDIRKNSVIYFAGLLAMLLTNGTEVLAPKALQWIIDALIAAAAYSGKISDSKSLIASQEFRRILTSSMVFVLVAFFGLLGRVFWRFTLARMTHVSSNNMRQNLWESIRNAELDRLSHFTLGDLMNRAIGDVNAARWIYGFTLVLTCDVIFFTGLGAVAMILIHPGLALACLSTFLIIPFIAVKLARMEYAAHEAAQNELTTLSEQVSHSIRGIRAQRASDSFYVWIDSMKESASRYGHLRLKAQKISINSYPLCNLPTITSYVILLLWGTQLVAAKTITVGEFAALASYVYLLQGPLGADIGGLISEWQRGFASLRRIGEIHNLRDSKGTFDSELFAKKPIALESDQRPLTSSLQIQDLSIARDGKCILRGVTMDVARGEWVGISGKVGSGKSSLLQTIAGLLPPGSGSVKIEGKPVAGTATSRLTNHSTSVAYAAEKPFVFSGTIRHNLSLNKKFTDDELWRALRVVGLSGEVERMQNGLDNVVGEGGVALSGGQRQRLALARLVLRPAQLILLDDPLSAVDADTEATVIRNLKECWSTITVVLTSNKTSTLDCCHRRAIISSDGLIFQGHHFENNRIYEGLAHG